MLSSPRLKVVFFKTQTGNEPVRDWLKSLSVNEKKTIGEDIKTVQFGWPMGMPLVRKEVKMTENNNFIGSDFDDFLAEEGLLEEAEAIAVKRVLAYQITELMKSQHLSKSEMAQRMKTSRAALDRLLDPTNRSVTLHTMDKAARSLGKRLRLTLT